MGSNKDVNKNMKQQHKTMKKKQNEQEKSGRRGRTMLERYERETKDKDRNKVN